MKTSYGLEFQITPAIEPDWSEYGKLVAHCHLKNVGVIMIDTEYGQPIDNEYDLEEIYQMLESGKLNNDNSSNGE